MPPLPYEKALELKNAGWPQPLYEKTSHMMILREDMSEPYSPSLEELIEACPKRTEEGFLFTIRYGGEHGNEEGVFAAGYTGYEVFYGPVGIGATPKEAVANLWLLRNTK